MPIGNITNHFHTGEVHHHQHHYHETPRVERVLEDIREALKSLNLKGIENLMRTLDEIIEKANASLEKARANTTALGSLTDAMRRNLQIIVDLRLQLEEAGTSQVKLTALKGTMDEIIANEQSEEETIAKSILENTGTPPNGTPTVPPVEVPPVE